MNIHILTNSLKINSGYANVARYLAKGLTDLGHDITFTGMQTAYTSEYSYGYEVLPIDTRYIDDKSQYLLNLQNNKVDMSINIYQSDTDMNTFSKLFPKTIFYTTIEGARVPNFTISDFVAVLKNGGMVVVPTKFASKEIEKAGIKNIPVIPYGYNDKIFRPLDIKNQKNLKYCYYATDVGKYSSDPMLLHKNGCYDCKVIKDDQCNCPYYKEEIVSMLKWSDADKKWAQNNIPISKLKDEFRGKFLLLSVGHNFGVRKRHERLLKAYSTFMNMSQMYKDRTHLHIHTVPIAIDGINIIEEISLLGIEKNVSFSYGRLGPQGWSEEAMSILYNIADCHISASSGEGFNLPVTESMACGKPQIATNYTSFPELIGEDMNMCDDKGHIGPRGILVKCFQQLTPTGSYKALVEEEDMAKCMKLMFIGEDRDIYSKNAIKFAQNFTWNEIIKKWNELLKTI